MTPGVFARDFGRLEGKQDETEKRLERLEELVIERFDKLDARLDRSMGDLASRVASLEASDNKRTGAWVASEKVLVAIGSVVVLLGGGLVSWITAHLGIK